MIAAARRSASPAPGRSPGDDFDRWPTSSSLLEAILDSSAATRTTRGFMESGALAASGAPRHRTCRPASCTASRRRSARSTRRRRRRACSPARPTRRRLGGDIVLPRRRRTQRGWPRTPPTTLTSTAAAEAGHAPAEAGLAGQHDRLGAVGDLQLHEDVARVVAHRLGRQRRARLAISAFSRPLGDRARAPRARGR